GYDLLIKLDRVEFSETIAKLASGIKRFELPDEFNPIKLYQQIVTEPKTGYGEDALRQLAQVFANRRQYPRAATYWKESIDKFGDREQHKKQGLDQIAGNWGAFEVTTSQPA